MSKTTTLSKNENLHRPLSSALNDSGNVFAVGTFAQVDDFQCRRHHQIDKPSVGDGAATWSEVRHVCDRIKRGKSK
jgi:hypothetical protein